MKKEFGELFSNTCTIIGEYEINTPSMMLLKRINKLNLKKNNINYHIEISALAYQKKIVVNTEPDANFCEIFKIVTEILRFENIFEGCFYKIVSYKFAENEYIEKIKKYLLSYFESSYSFTPFPFQYNDKDYRKLFFKWKKLKQDWGIIHSMFLYSTYTKGITSDIKMALLLEVFEPIAEQLYTEGEIVLKKAPYKTFSERCTNCGNIVTKTVVNKSLYFADKLKPVITKFGCEIFQKENIDKLIEYSVGVRNKVDHVKKTSNKCMSGKQCGFYLYKFSLLYRFIVLKRLGIHELQLKPTIISWRERFDKKYRMYIIR